MDIRQIDSYNKTYLDGLERSSQFSYSAQYFWWKKFDKLNSIVSDIINRKLNNKEKIRILDIGCQVGHDIFKMSDILRDKNIEWYGIELNPDFLKIAYMRRHLRNYHKFYFVSGNIEKFCFKNIKFDIVICTEVFEHLNNSDSAADNIKNLMIESGYFIMSTPNISNRAFELCKFIGKNFFKSLHKKFNADTISETEHKKKLNIKNEEDHINLRTFEQWKKFFIKKNFFIKHIQRGSMFYGSKYIDKKPLLFIIITFFDLMFDFMNICKTWSYNFFLVMTK